MARIITILVLIIITSVLFFGIFSMNPGAQATDDLSQVLHNQRLILDKLETIDKKLDIIKIRIKI